MRARDCQGERGQYDWRFHCGLLYVVRLETMADTIRDDGGGKGEEEGWCQNHDSQCTVSFYGGFSAQAQASVMTYFFARQNGLR